MTLGMAASGGLCNGFGVVYPGAVAYLADAAITLAAGTTVPAATAFSTIDLKLYLLRPRDHESEADPRFEPAQPHRISAYKAQPS